jgi:hypothetical protein
MTRRILIEIDRTFIRVDNKYFNDVDRALEEIRKRIRKY